MPLTECTFAFSRRMLNFFEYVGISTVGELAAIPLSELTRFRGFKTKCKAEMILFIEAEGLQKLYADFAQWKTSGINNR
ncbi:hypothetical protein DEU42_106195 [Flavobacterium sp. AG291]|nr:hypothetical protein DEU42_106195 [Flavobacterium sp. AG291]